MPKPLVQTTRWLPTERAVSTVAKLEHRQQTPMPMPWGDHLELAGCVALIGEEDLKEASTAMGRCLFHLQRDLLLETLSVRTEEPPMAHQRAQICAQLQAVEFQDREN